MKQNGLVWLANISLLCSIVVTRKATAFGFGRSSSFRGVGCHFSQRGNCNPSIGNNLASQRKINENAMSWTPLSVASKIEQKRKHHACLLAAIPSIATRTPANIAVAIDQPLLPTNGRTAIWTSLLPIILSDAFKTAIIAFVFALLISLRSKASISVFMSLLSTLGTYYSLAKGRVIRVYNKIKSFAVKSTKGIPMTFGNGEDAWRACILSSKESVGNSKYVRYTFGLPNKSNILPLSLGQKLSLCCLDDDENVAKGGFYLASPRSALGSFSIVVPRGAREDVEFAIGTENSNFVRVLENDLKIGDEVALLPGDQTLQYRGEFMPVTDILYIGSGAGIVPIVDQVKSVIPSGISSVKSVSIMWVNEDANDFQVAFRELKNEYYKYHKLRTISCYVNNVKDKFTDYHKYDEIREIITDFSPGKMVVVSGPAIFSKNAVSYLLQRGYPEECVCVLPS